MIVYNHINHDLSRYTMCNMSKLLLTHTCTALHIGIPQNVPLRLSGSEVHRAGCRDSVAYAPPPVPPVNQTMVTK